MTSYAEANLAQSLTKWMRPAQITEHLAEQATRDLESHSHRYIRRYRQTENPATRTSSPL